MVDSHLFQALQAKLDQKTKPPGSLGRIEEIALKLGLIQGTLSPVVSCPTLVIFAADHGIATEGVSAYPQEVTHQMVLNFLNEGAAANIFAKRVGCNWLVVDAGVKGDFYDHPRLIRHKIGPGTRNFRWGPAMSLEECHQCLQRGGELVQKLVKQGVNTFVFGEMGIGNSSSAALLVHVLTGLPLDDAVGPGTGVSGPDLSRKKAVLRACLTSANQKLGSLETLAYFGGFEIAMMCGAYLEAAKNRCVSLVDGYIASAAALVASRISAQSMGSMIFSHCSQEPGHRSLLHSLKQVPVFDLGLRLGEGTGALLCLPLVQAATDMLNEMATMDGAHVSGKKDKLFQNLSLDYDQEIES